MGSERTPDLDLPALRAVIAGVRKLVETWPKSIRISCRPSDLTTLASACERLAEENERLRAYASHRPDCNLNRQAEWDEAAETLASCPDGPDKAQAEYELSVARSRCTCGLATPAPAGKGEK